MPNLKSFGDTLLLDVDRIIAVQYFPSFRISIATRIDITLQTADGVVKITTERRPLMIFVNTSKILQNDRFHLI